MKKLRPSIRPYPFLLALVLIISVLVIGLRGTMSQSGAAEMDATNNMASFQGLNIGNPIWTDNFTDSAWRLSSPNTTAARLQVNRTLSLSVAFSTEPNAQSVIIYRSVNISLAIDPVMLAELTVSAGVHYGIRFSGVDPSGSSFNAWREGSKLQHRPGLGIPENITANLVAETYLANGQLPVLGSRITKVWFYLETPANTGGGFQLQMDSLQASPLNRTTSASQEISGNFSNIVINFDLPSVNQSLFQAYASFDIRGTSSLTYTLFFISGLSIAAQGYTYTQSVITTHQVAVLLPSLVSGFPSVLPNVNSSSLIIGAISGSITYFRIDDFNLKFTATNDPLQGSVDPTTARAFIVYYLVFLFVTPIAAVILLTRVFKVEE